MANESLTFGARLGCWLAAILSLPSGASAQCMLCDPQAEVAAKKAPSKPLQVEVETSLDFSRIGLIRSNEGGTAEIDPVTGQRIIRGALLDLGGLPVQGTVTIRGEPKEHVEVGVPQSVTLTSPGGATAVLSGFQTSLKNNPKIGDDGTLRFTFGGVLQIDGRADGEFQGAVPVTVNYK